MHEKSHISLLLICKHANIHRIRVGRFLADMHNYIGIHTYIYYPPEVRRGKY